MIKHFKLSMGWSYPNVIDGFVRHVHEPSSGYCTADLFPVRAKWWYAGEFGDWGAGIFLSISPRQRSKKEIPHSGIQTHCKSAKLRDTVRLFFFNFFPHDFSSKKTPITIYCLRLHRREIHLRRQPGMATILSRCLAVLKLAAHDLAALKKMSMCPSPSRRRLCRGVQLEERWSVEAWHLLYGNFLIIDSTWLGTIFLEITTDSETLKHCSQALRILLKVSTNGLKIYIYKATDTPNESLS
jgi:hypothetical protein